MICRDERKSEESIPGGDYLKNINYKTNRGLFIGVLLSAIFFGAEGSGLVLPDVIKGFILGLALLGYGYGFYGMKHDISKLSKWKKALLHRNVSKL